MQIGRAQSSGIFLKMISNRVGSPQPIMKPPAWLGLALNIKGGHFSPHRRCSSLAAGYRSGRTKFRGICQDWDKWGLLLDPQPANALWAKNVFKIDSFWIIIVTSTTYHYRIGANKPTAVYKNFTLSRWWSIEFFSNFCPKSPKKWTFGQKSGGLFKFSLNFPVVAV